MNNVYLTGNIGKLNVGTTRNGKSRVYFSLAHNPRGRNGTENITHWYNVVVFGKQAEFLADKLKVGMRVAINGKLDQYVDSEGRTHISIVAFEVMRLEKFVSMMDEPPNNIASPYDDIPPQQPQPKPQQQQSPRRLQVDNDDGELDPFDDNIFEV